MVERAAGGWVGRERGGLSWVSRLIEFGFLREEREGGNGLGLV